MDLAPEPAHKNAPATCQGQPGRKHNTMATPIPDDAKAGQGQQHLFQVLSPLEADAVTATPAPAAAPEVTAPSADQEQGRYISLYIAELAILDGKARAMHLWCVLLEFADWQTNTCYPGRDTLAKRLGVTVDTVDAQIKVLAGLGLVTKSHRKTTDGDSDTNLYTLHRQRGVAESIRPPSRIHSATGSRAHSATVAEPIRPELIPEELIPEEQEERTADAGSLQTESLQDKPPKRARPKRERFVPPTVEEVAAYCRERKNGIDPEAFVASNEAKGWLVGRNRTPMVNWRAAVITWEKTHANQSGQPSGNRNGDRQGGTPPQSHYKKLTRI